MNQATLLHAVRFALVGLLLTAGAAGQAVNGSRTKDEQAVLNKLTAYIQKAFTGQWQAGCREDIERSENRYTDVLTKRSTGENVRRWELRKTVVTKTTYEYRLYLKGKKITGKRYSQAADNELLYEGKDTGIIFPYETPRVIRHPMEYLAMIGRGETSYRVDGRERVGDFEAWVIRFSTKAAAGGRLELLSGVIWLHPESGAVRRMDLDPKSWLFFAKEEIPKEFGEVRRYGHAAALRELSWRAEFDLETDVGINFPSRVEVAESYEDGFGEKVKTNEWTIRYGEFRFEHGGPGQAAAPEHPILKKAAVYCERLKTIALQYYCEEHIERTSYFYDVRRYIKSSGLENVGLPRKRWTPKRSMSKQIVYDYQLLKKGEQLEEKRRVLKVDGKEWSGRNEPENILPYQARYIVYGPIGFLSTTWQNAFEYFEEGEKRLPEEGRRMRIFTSQPNEFREDNSVYGRLWIDPETGAVRWISWDHESIDFFDPDDVPEMFKGLEKQLTWEAYYNVEKNGIYFPSRQVIREEYLGPAGEVIPGDVWIVTYENYKFFTVDIDYEIKK
ncbi:MAG: hypothetical protein JW843_04675 [Candidatus Aminicenantes bacterium]|nr:hypothetical protein [Candidatus Aminicenantes bacterium]